VANKLVSEFAEISKEDLNIIEEKTKNEVYKIIEAK